MRVGADGGSAIDKTAGGSAGAGAAECKCNRDTGNGTRVSIPPESVSTYMQLVESIAADMKDTAGLSAPLPLKLPTQTITAQLGQEGRREGNRNVLMPDTMMSHNRNVHVEKDDAFLESPQR